MAKSKEPKMGKGLAAIPAKWNAPPAYASATAREQMDMLLQYGDQLWTKRRSPEYEDNDEGTQSRATDLSIEIEQALMVFAKHYDKIERMARGLGRYTVNPPST
jgi:hypothetical protein